MVPPPRSAAATSSARWAKSEPRMENASSITWRLLLMVSLAVQGSSSFLGGRHPDPASFPSGNPFLAKLVSGARKKFSDECAVLHTFGAKVTHRLTQLAPADDIDGLQIIDKR